LFMWTTGHCSFLSVKVTCTDFVALMLVCHFFSLASSWSTYNCVPFTINVNFSKTVSDDKHKKILNALSLPLMNNCCRRYGKKQLWPNLKYYPGFAWRDWGRLQTIVCRVVSAVLRFKTNYLRNTNQKCYGLSQICVLGCNGKFNHFLHVCWHTWYLLHWRQ
jgi:hypothetical protein